MATLPSGAFDATQVDPSSGIAADAGFTGWHPMVFFESEMKPTKSGTGEYLQLVAEVIDGHWKGRRLWVRLNLKNPSQQAVDIAYRELSAICHATGVMNVSDSVQLHNKPFLGNVEFEPATAANKARNNLTGCKSMDGSGPEFVQRQAAPARAAPAQAPAPASSGTPPWARKPAA